MEELKKIVNRHFNLDINNNTRKERYVFARACYYKACRDYLNIPYHQISDSLNKNHATILWSLKSLPDLLKYNKQLQRDYELVMTKLKFFCFHNEELSAKKLVLKYNNLLFETEILRGEIDELNELIYKLSEIE